MCFSGQAAIAFFGGTKILTLFVPDDSLRHDRYRSFLVYLYQITLYDMIGSNNSEFFCTK